MEFFQSANQREFDLPWNNAYRLSPYEREAVAHSIQQFHLGEGSEGRHFLRAGRTLRDPYFVPALYCFIQQEQRHSACLGRFMEQQGIPHLRRHWVDQIFRGVRKLAGLRTMVTVLVTAEIIAVPYYRALRQATASPLLRALCTEILREEATHLEFQADTLHRLGCPPAFRQLHRAMLRAACALVWREHRSVFAAAHYNWAQFWHEAEQELEAFHHCIAHVPPVMPQLADALRRG